MKIDGAKIIVTGGAGNIGLAIVNHLLGHGATVISLDFNLTSEVSLNKNYNSNFENFTIDVTNPDQVNLVIDAIFKKYGSIDVVINNAGLIYSEAFVNPTKMDFMHSLFGFTNCINANLNSVFIVTSAVVREMVNRRSGGLILNISSISANGNVGQTAYSAAKAGVNAMTLVWSKELGQWGIRSNAIAPGFIETGSTSGALSQASLSQIIKETPLGRLGKLSEVCAAISAVIENDFINGTILNLDGGLRI